MLSPPVLIEVAGDPSPRRPIRVRTEHNGHEHDRLLAWMRLTGIEIQHRQTRQDVVVPWRQVLAEGGEMFGISASEFATWLLEIAKSSSSHSPSGLSASDPGDAHGSDLC